MKQVFLLTLKLVTAVIIALIPLYTFSHALWIETPFEGQVGKKHEVKVFYGEYGKNERDSVSKWYSDIKDYTLWLTTPDGSRTKLETIPFNVYTYAGFIPEKEGTYLITIQHAAKDFPGSTRYEFLSQAYIRVGKKNLSFPENNNILRLSPSSAIGKVNKKIEFPGFFDNKPNQDIQYEIVSPSGWCIKLKADAQGKLSFIPLWQGTYFIEASHMERTPGDLKEKPYKSTWRGVTYLVEVK